MKKAKRIAVAGATGMVGQAFQNLLEKNFFPEAQIDLLACLLYTSPSPRD